MTKEDRIRRGKQSEQLMEDPVISAAFSDVESQIIAAWKTAPTAEAREHQHAKLQVLGDVKARFSAFIHDGIIASRVNTQ